MAVNTALEFTREYAIAANANPEDDTYWKIDYRYYDQYTLQEVPVDHIYGRYPEAKAADKLLRMNYDIYTGATLGKTLAFLASLVCPLRNFSSGTDAPTKRKKSLRNPLGRTQGVKLKRHSLFNQKRNNPHNNILISFHNR